MRFLHGAAPMFDHVVLRRHERGTAVTAGQIAEALLFYQKVHLVVDNLTLGHLLQQIGQTGLLALTGRPDFSAVYTEEMLATKTDSIGVSQAHDFQAVSFAGTKDIEFRSPQERLQHQVERLGLGASDARKFSQRFLQRVPLRRLSGSHFVKGGIPAAARQDLQDPEFFAAAVRTIVANIPGGYDAGSTLRAEVITSRLGNFVFDNIDFDGINARRAAMTPPLEPVTMAHVLMQLQDAKADFVLAAHYGGDFVTSSATSAVVRLRYEALLHRRSENAEAQRNFVSVALPDMPTIAEAVDSGERTFPEFLRLLDQSDRFKRWLKSANPDDGLVREYLLSTARQDWVQTSKVKALRYLLTLAAEATNPLAGFAAGVMDNFVVEKLLGGWRPNHFVSDRLVPFVSGGSK